MTENQERVVKLRHGCIKLSLSPDFNAFDLDPRDRQFFGDLVDLLNRYESSLSDHAEDA